MIYELDSEQLRMVQTGPAPAHDFKPEKATETFCVYLATQFIAKKGFEVANIPEAHRLIGPCNYVLTRSDGYTFTILCMLDREAYPNEQFHLDLDEVRQIGEACLKYASKIGPARMPVFIRIMEIGPGATVKQQKRLELYRRASLTSSVVPSAMIIDPAAGRAWNSAKSWYTKGAYQGFVERMLSAPREPEATVTPPAIAIAKSSFPVVTIGILMLLFAAFAAEILFGIEPQTKLLQPAVTTLLAFGGLTRIGALQYAEWYRLLSAPLLHANALHLVMNAVALLLAGWRLESLIGRAWFGAIYVGGALGGSLMPLALNPPAYIEVGASGAIMGLAAAMLIASMHFTPGAIRTQLLARSILVLVLTLVPLAGDLWGQSIDYAGHIGGAAAGALIGLVMLKVWSRSEIWPRFRRAALAIAISGAVALVYPAFAVPRIYRAMAFMTQLIPADQVPKSSAEMRERAADLIAQYPHDPRPRFIRAADMLDAGDLAGAEQETRTALADEDLWRPILSPQLGSSLRIMLAVAIQADRPDEARSTARPACAAVTQGPMRKLLDDHRLCVE